MCMCVCLHISASQVHVSKPFISVQLTSYMQAFASYISCTENITHFSGWCTGNLLSTSLVKCDVLTVALECEDAHTHTRICSVALGNITPSFRLSTAHDCGVYVLLFVEAVCRALLLNETGADIEKTSADKRSGGVDIILRALGSVTPERARQWRVETKHLVTHTLANS